jgi:hypothetical protein
MDAELAAFLLPNALGALINELASDSAVAGKALLIVAKVIDIAETSGLDLSWLDAEAVTNDDVEPYLAVSLSDRFEALGQL